MSDNPKSYEVILLDHTEMGHDEAGEFMSVYNYDGTSYKIGAKRQLLWGVFNNAVKGTPIALTFETWTPPDSTMPRTYIVGAEAITANLIITKGIQSTLKRLLLAKDDDRNRSLALSYAKDIYVAELGLKNIVAIPSTPDGILKLATTFFYFIKGEREVETPHIEAHEKPLTEEEYQK